VFVALGIQNVMGVRYFAICGLPVSTIFFNFFSQPHDFRKKKDIEQKVCFDFRTIFV
jgi:hypothetical protein